MKKFKWGILGCGGIAGKFASDLPLTKYGQLAAVGSRSRAKGQKFAAQHGAARAYGSYEEVAADPDVDIVYVATPHPSHMENTLLAIAHGKHVLCEKPFALNARQSRRMIAATQKKGVFVMEAMWARFFSALAQIRTWIAQKLISTNGRIIPIAVAENFAEVTAEIIKDRAQYTEMSEQSRNIAEQFSWTSMAQDYINLYRKIAKAQT